MNLLAETLCAIFALILVSSVCSFGHDGHEIIANIANGRIQKVTALSVRDVLDGETMSDVANWADDVTKEKGWSASLHFVNVLESPCDNSSDCEVVYKRDCEENVCVEGAIVNYTAIEHELSPRHRNSSAANEALKFVIHFVGDVHQPLHVARDSDRGGVITDVNFYVPGQGSEWNLHNVWDFGMIVRNINETFGGSQDLFTANLLRLIDSEWSRETDEWLLCNGPMDSLPLPISDVEDVTSCVQQWGQESLSAATSYAYLNEFGQEIQEGDSISDEYYRSRLGVVQKRLAMAGVRLGALLDRIFED